MKKKTIMRTLATMLSFVMAAAIFTGCVGGGKEQTTTQEETTMAESEETEETKETVEETTETADTGSGEASTGIVDDLGDVEAKSSYKIGFTISVRDQFLSTLESAADAESKNLGISLTVVDANNSSNTQLQNVQTFVATGMDAILINLVNTDNAQEMIDAAGDVPVVFVNRMPDAPMTAGKQTYVGSNEEDAGRFQGEFLAEYFKKEGNTSPDIVILTGQPGLQNTTLRTESAKKALEDNGLTPNYVYEDTAEWDRAKAQNKMQIFIGTGQKFDAVVCNNDEMALGAIEGIRNSGMDPKETPIVGIDATQDGLEGIESGEMAFTVFQNPVGQGAGAIRAATVLANGDPIDIDVPIPFEPVSVDNYKDYLNP